MSHFYGTLKGSRGEATRGGTKSSGMTTYTAGWRGAVHVEVYTQADGRDAFMVSLVPWQGSGGESVVLARGLLDSTRKRFPW